MEISKDELLLQATVAMTAGLHKEFSESFIARQFPALNSQFTKLRGIYSGLLGDGKNFGIGGLDGVAELLRTLKSERVIFAGSQFGSPLVSIAALASLGANVAGIHLTLGNTQKQILDKYRVHAIDITEPTNLFAFIRPLQKLHDDGHVIWLMCDAPGKSRARYNFLGYAVRCANLIERFARIGRCTVVPTHCRLISEREASVHCDAPLADYDSMTQRLLSNVETRIYEDPANYIWDGASIIFSDPQAILNGVRCLPDFLDWRERSAVRKMRAS
jgi:hypothetical protein